MIIGVFLIDLIELNIILKDSGGHQKCFLPQICMHMFTLFTYIFFGVFLFTDTYSFYVYSDLESYFVRFFC